MKIQDLYKGLRFRYLITVADRKGSQAKLDKAIDHGYLMAGLSLAPWTLSGHNTCAFSSPCCRERCLNWSGHGGVGLDEYRMNNIQHARVARTQLFFDDPQRFWIIFHYEMSRFLKKARRLKLVPVFRPNITSDILWEKKKTGPDVSSKNMFDTYPTVQFMDYTAIPLHLRKNRSDNYHLTFSLKETNHNDAFHVMEKGLANVAVVFKKLPYEVRRKAHNTQGTLQDIPSMWAGYPVIDGDEHDLRFLDKPGHIVALRSKGNIDTDNARGFIHHPYASGSLSQVTLGLTG